MPLLLTYSKFHTIEDAGQLIELIRNDGIPFTIDQEINQLDKVYLGDNLDPMISLKIPQDQFLRVNLLLARTADSTSEETQRDYYLYSFSNEELVQVIMRPIEWNAFDRSLAEKILRSRNATIPIEQGPLLQYYQPERLSKQWVMLGYILSTLAITGIFIGLSILDGKKTLNNGEIVSIYDKKSLRHGDLMSTIGTIATIYYGIKLFRQFLEQA